jgi:hypothetical protein
MTPAAGHGQLYDAIKTLKARWEQTEDLWADSVRREFEETILLPMEQLAGDALRAIDRLEQVVCQVRNELT